MNPYIRSGFDNQALTNQKTERDQQVSEKDWTCDNVQARKPTALRRKKALSNKDYGTF